MLRVPVQPYSIESTLMSMKPATKLHCVCNAAQKKHIQMNEKDSACGSSKDRRPPVGCPIGLKRRSMLMRMVSLVFGSEEWAVPLCKYRTKLSSEPSFKVN